MWFRTAKDELIAELRGQLVEVRAERDRLLEECARLKAEPEAKGKDAEAQEKKRPGTRYMGERMRRLTERSLRGAILRDPKRNLVAEMPPPGAIPQGAALVDGPGSGR